MPRSPFGCDVSTVLKGDSVRDGIDGSGWDAGRVCLGGTSLWLPCGSTIKIGGQGGESKRTVAAWYLNNGNGTHCERRASSSNL